MEGFTVVNVLLTFFMFLLLVTVFFFSFASEDMKRGYGLGSAAFFVFVLFIAVTFALLRCFTIYQDNANDRKESVEKAWKTECQIDVNSRYLV